jgi:hypothetical protein
MEESNDEEKLDVALYKHCNGLSFIYLYNSRPNICNIVGLINKFINRPRKPCLIVVKRILRYVKRTINYELLFVTHRPEDQLEMMGYSDSDWCGDMVDKTSILWNMFMYHGALKNNM